ncbi:SDR family NAD(P)-dependent oxidoreductase [Nocardia goodfellowii]|uniref:NAD(P)-dependent dehydrogenase (Short-subunit alcohol dehydrogenase family) n=1 Tax=Nocardia goodfellowii TaxID=882446 RepID=A0ABS4QMT2_9NOCA|nr:SDR family NAD(P)-dependent oxidoreductase [Nocardia goodfellowii]MBP2192339.1 NAD(P)-dependent dehydrogenase (short-subunit alcohol dehydrogenase family) [Nocardia goodfellowii]
MTETQPIANGRPLAERVATRLLYPTSRPDEKSLHDAVSGRIVLITGASHGIGKASARKLGAAGAVVLLVARSTADLAAVAADIRGEGGAAHTYTVDLTDFAAVEALAGTLLSEHGHVDVVINNAGKSIRRPIDESYDRFHDFTRTMDINYLGPVRLLLSLLPHMRERKQGHIVNVATWGLLMPPTPRWSAYGASKGAFDTWLRTVATEIAGDGVTTTSIYMPLVHTRMSAPTDFSNIPGLTVDEASDLICHAVTARPREIAPWWQAPLQAWTDLSRSQTARFMERAFRRGRA